MLTLFKQDRTFLIPTIVVIAIALWSDGLFALHNNSHYYDTNAMPFYEIALKLIKHDGLFSNIISILLLLLNVLLIIRLNSQHKLIKSGAYLPGILYLMMACSFSEMRQLNPILFATVFLLIATNIIFGIYKIENNLSPFFISAFWIAVGSLFYFNLIFFISFLFAGLILLRPFNWREWFSVIIGALTPYILLVGIYFYTDSLPYLVSIIENNIVGFTGYSFMTVFYIIFYSFSLFIFLISVLVVFSGNIKKISVIKYYSLFLILLIITIVLFFAIPATSFEVIAILAIPFAFFLANYLINISSNALGEVIFLTFLGIQIAQMIIN